MAIIMLNYVPYRSYFYVLYRVLLLIFSKLILVRLLGFVNDFLFKNTLIFKANGVLVLYKTKRLLDKYRGCCCKSGVS